MVTPVLHLLAGIVVLGVTFAVGDLLSIGTALGVLLILSAAARYAMARGT